MDESYTDRPETIVTHCFVTALAELDGTTFLKTIDNVKQLLSCYKNMFVKRGFNMVMEEIESQTSTRTDVVK